MKVGFSFLEAGTIRYKSSHSILSKNLLDIVIGGLFYWFFGYNLNFGESQGNGFIGF